jgi:glyoxylase-like metal-dependent hydrolase (beta-lactamase superfamily II)
MDGRAETVLRRGLPTCHCLLVETPSGLVLVRPEFRTELTAIRQIQHRGLDPRDVRHIVRTHLDFDHEGGMDDFPDATVHLMAEEAEYALLQKTWPDRARFRPQQWSTRDPWRLYRPDQGERWFGFERVQVPEGVPPEILMVSLPGHTYGHAGVELRRDNRWLLLAGDASFYHAEMIVDHPHCTPGPRFYQWMMEKDRARRLANQHRLRELKRRHGRLVDILCSHDAVEFVRHPGRSPQIPVEPLASSDHA